jgi:hypothetical protein
MKKYVNPIPAGGAPLHNNRLITELNGELWDAIQGILTPFTNQLDGNNGFIISGCDITPNAANFDISAGIVFLDGQFMRLPAATNQTFTKYIAAKAVSYETKVFADGGTKNLIEVKEAELVGAAPGSGHYITISSLISARNNYFKNVTPGTEYVDISAVETTRIINRKIVEIGAWDMDATSEKVITSAILGIPNGKIVNVDVLIYSDDAIAGASNKFRAPLVGDGFTGSAGGYWYIEEVAGSDQIVLARVVGGFFDATIFNDSVNNRGFVEVAYLN